MHSSWNYYGPSKLELIELPKMKTHYGIDSSSINISPTFAHFSVFSESRFQGLPRISKPTFARQMLTAYINNAEMRSGTHLRSCLNIFFDARALRSTL